jgi:hypothetical protein
VWNRFRLRLRLRPDRSLSLFSKIIMIEYLTSIFVIRFFRLSFSIKLAAVQVSGDAHMKLREIKCHLRGGLLAVTEYKLRRPRTRSL